MRSKFWSLKVWSKFAFYGLAGIISALTAEEMHARKRDFERKKCDLLFYFKEFCLVTKKNRNTFQKSRLGTKLSEKVWCDYLHNRLQNIIPSEKCHCYTFFRRFHLKGSPDSFRL